MPDESVAETGLGDRALTKAERKLVRREAKQRERARELQRRGRRRAWRYGVLLLGAVAVAGGAWLLARSDSGDTGVSDSRVSAQASDWVKGGPADGSTAKVVLIEYGDFQCPACGAYYPVVKSMHEELGEALQIVWRHFPLREAHPQAQLAAQAAEAAGNQQKFWDMHNILFERQSDWAGKSDAREKFMGYAAELGLNAEQFARDIDAGEVREAVEDDYHSGVAAGVNATPTFYLNGAELGGFRTLDEFRERIVAAAAS
ncbi:MAG TPA: thioredoxin domain-containing protein [Candidatus Andersenbacteria bacterium]|nr:thioredoxin domain-containing protein [Candidatus Andersenbacteria bacterium]